MKLEQACEEFTLTTDANGLATSTMKLNKAACLLVDWMIEQVSDSECPVCNIPSNEENTVYMKTDDNTD